MKVAVERRQVAVSPLSLRWVRDTNGGKMEDPDIFGDISRMHQKQITIHAGDEGLAETGRVLYVEPDWTTDDLLQAAGRRLDLVSTPKRMFNCNGEGVKLCEYCSLVPARRRTAASTSNVLQDVC